MRGMDRINDALATLESRIGEQVDAAELARIALMGEHHFRRMFATLAGMGLGEYVKRRRMTLAAAEVRDGRDAMLAIAQRYGYANGDSFARAFREVHGVAPTDARDPATRLHSQSRLSFHLVLQGATTMTHRIVDLDAFTIVGRATRVPLVHRGPNPDIAAFTASIPVEETVALKARNDAEPRGVLAVSDDLDPSYAEGTMLTYVHGVAVTNADEADDRVLEVAAGQWLVLEPTDPSDAALQELWPYAFTEWFPANGYELASGPSIVTMRLRDDGSGLDRELWLPISRSRTRADRP